ncbi:MAG TPA: GNAT family N-acyltransferase [Rhizomicrobium sp.]
MVNVYEPGPLEGRLDQWPVLAVSGALEVRLAETDAEVEAAQRLRYHVFYEEMSAVPTPEMREQRMDFDKFDPVCDHLLVVDRDRIDEDGQPAVIGCYRMMREEHAAQVGGFYTSGEYDISKLLAARKGAKMLELGRSCVLKEYRSRAGALQLLWKGLMAYAARFSIDVMFGCASFAGIDPDTHAAALTYLHHHAALPADLAVKALPHLYVSMDRMPADHVNPKEALRDMPPLIKGYLRAGCYIGDGAVIDRQFSTTDVFIYVPLDTMSERYRSRFGLSN